MVHGDDGSWFTVHDEWFTAMMVHGSWFMINGSWSHTVHD
jgi:hypothetical protein